MTLRSISKINILNCIVYLARKERWNVIKIRALIISAILLSQNVSHRRIQISGTLEVNFMERGCQARNISRVILVEILQLLQMEALWTPHPGIRFLREFFVHYSETVTNSVLQSLCVSLWDCLLWTGVLWGIIHMHVSVQCASLTKRRNLLSSPLDHKLGKRML